MKKFNLLLTILILTVSIVFSSDDKTDEVLHKIKTITEKGYFTFDKKDYMEAIALCQRVLDIDNTDTHARYYLAYSEYRLMNIAMVNGLFNEMNNHSRAGKEYAVSLFEDSDYKSEAHVVLAAIIMMDLAVDQSKGMELSGLIHSHLQSALIANRDNPRAYLIQATMLLNTPEAYGGGPGNALPVFLKAQKLFNDKDSNELMPSWGKLENLAWLGQTYERLKDLEKARNTYTMALEIFPEFNWVKYNLLPAVENKLIESESQQ